MLETDGCRVVNYFAGRETLPLLPETTRKFRFTPLAPWCHHVGKELAQYEGQPMDLVLSWILINSINSPYSNNTKRL